MLLLEAIRKKAGTTLMWRLRLPAILIWRGKHKFVCFVPMELFTIFNLLSQYQKLNAENTTTTSS
jgi:hypothetical protein